MSHILVVDDEPGVLRSACRVLRSVGYDARGAGGGAAALRAMRADRPTLVLLDVGMPDVSGFDVLRAARDDVKLAGVPIVMLTAQDVDGRDAALGLGAREWVSKGQPDAMLQVVGRFVSK